MEPHLFISVLQILKRLDSKNERIVITELQPEGKKRMDVKSFLAGHNLIVGNKFTQQSSPKN